MSDSVPHFPAAGGKHCSRADAQFVLQKLRDAGHVAYFAGGCVRDLLLEREPKDWDVATDAPPGRVRELFRHTQAVGAAFGVILVRHRGSQVEVATFRSDGDYTDGRRPDAVRFTSAEEDARRRDFTINGLFLDPLDVTDAEPLGRVIDFVGGRQDLADRRLRAIGDPARRFEEDHLRLLRAVRFAARFGFAIEPATSGEIKAHAPMLTRISPERIAEELRVMLPQPTRSLAWRLLDEHDLAQVMFRFIEIPTGDPDESRGIDAFFSRLAPGEPLPFSLALAAVALQWAWWASPAEVDVRHWLSPPIAHRLMRGLRKALRLSNQECEEVEQILAGLSPIVAPTRPTLATLKRFLARPTNAGSRLLMAALAEAGLVDEPLAESLLADLLELEQTEFAPPPLITGDDLTAIGLPPGPKFRAMLDAAYDAQLEGHVTTREEAIEIARKVGRGK